MLGPSLLPLFVFVCFSMTPLPLLNERTFLNDPLKYLAGTKFRNRDPKYIFSEELGSVAKTEDFSLPLLWINELLHLYFLAIAREKKHHDGTNYPWKIIGKKSILRSLPSSFFRWFRTIKGPLMQIKKSHDMFVFI